MFLDLSTGFLFGLFLTVWFFTSDNRALPGLIVLGTAGVLRLIEAVLGIHFVVFEIILAVCLGIVLIYWFAVGFFTRTGSIAQKARMISHKDSKT